MSVVKSADLHGLAVSGVVKVVYEPLLNVSTSFLYIMSNHYSDCTILECLGKIQAADVFVFYRYIYVKNGQHFSVLLIYRVKLHKITFTLNTFKIIEVDRSYLI